MKLKYFESHFDTLGAIKNRYRDLCRQYHPDLNPDMDRIYMQEINAEYHAILKGKSGSLYQGAEGEEHKTYTYDEATESAVASKLAELLKAQLIGCDILLIGTWLWIVGETKQHKEALGKNGLKCSWHTKRECWYWSPKPWHGRSSHRTLKSLMNKYGGKTYEYQTKLD